MLQLEVLRKNKNLSQYELAEKLNMTQQRISAYEKGKREPDIETLKIFANFFNCSIDYLLGKDVLIPKKSRQAVVLVYGTIPAGIPMEMIEDIIDTEEIDSNMLKGDKQYFGLKIKGNSMFPEYLEGDTIICEKVENCENGQDCVVMVNGNDGTFKRVFKNENGIILQPLNSQYQPMIYSNEQIEKLPIKIIGKVVELRRKK